MAKSVRKFTQVRKAGARGNSIYDKLRKPIPRPGSTFRDKSKYQRTSKYPTHWTKDR